MTSSVASVSVSSAVPASQATSGPISFAAVAAAGANKERQRQQNPYQSQPAPLSEEPMPSGSSEITQDEDVYEE